jgi:tRNA dimethylallyltransferase
VTDRPAVVAVVGPTASGKSDLGIEIARAIGGEVVNADAMQLYLGMDIGTAKVPESERQGVPHHLLDIWPVTERASVVDYQRRAVTAVEDIRSRGRTPVVVGGSGLYVRALLDHLHVPPTDPALRSELERELAAVGSRMLHARLHDADPAAAQVILPSNGRRIVRALEVVALTGSFSATLPDGTYRWPGTLQIGLGVPDLAGRIEQRVVRMFEQGLVAEVRGLEAVGLRDAPTASRALGYAQVLADPATAVASTVTATRRFARRQRSWFRRDTRISWVDAPAAGRQLIGL